MKSQESRKCSNLKSKRRESQNGAVKMLRETEQRGSCRPGRYGQRRATATTATVTNKAPMADQSLKSSRLKTPEPGETGDTECESADLPPPPGLSPASSQLDRESWLEGAREWSFAPVVVHTDLERFRNRDGKENIELNRLKRARIEDQIHINEGFSEPAVKVRILENSEKKVEKVEKVEKVKMAAEQQDNNNKSAADGGKKNNNNNVEDDDDEKEKKDDVEVDDNNKDDDDEINNDDRNNKDDDDDNKDG